MRELEVLPDKDALTRRAAELFLDLKPATVALAGGSTPKSLYARLASEPIDWSRSHIFWGDERPVPPDHPDSNYRMANEALLSKVRIPSGNVHRIQADREKGAELYEKELHSRFGSEPRFDLVLLGMGSEGHTASLFPDSAALKETVRWAVPNWIEKLKSRRVTLTFPVLNAAKAVVFLISGADKAPAARDILKDRKPLPAGLVEPKDGRLVWLLDRAAAAAL